MSTRSIVAAEFEDGIRGVYVHSDGYPEGKWGMLNQLSEKIARDGAEKAIRTILGKPNGWSSLIEHDELPQFDRDGRFLLVKGYGVQYSRKLIKAFGKDYRQGSSEYRRPGDGGEEYFYLIRRDGIIDWCAGDWPETEKIKHHKEGGTIDWEVRVSMDGGPTVTTVAVPVVSEVDDVAKAARETFGDAALAVRKSEGYLWWDIDTQEYDRSAS